MPAFIVLTNIKVYGADVPLLRYNIHLQKPLYSCTYT